MRLDNPALNGSPILEGRRDGNAVLPYDRSPLRRVAGTGPLTPFKCAGSWGALMRARVS